MGNKANGNAREKTLRPLYIISGPSLPFVSPLSFFVASISAASSLVNLLVRLPRKFLFFHGSSLAPSPFLSPRFSRAFIFSTLSRLYSFAFFSRRQRSEVKWEKGHDSAWRYGSYLWNRNLRKERARASERENFPEESESNVEQKEKKIGRDVARVIKILLQEKVDIL